MGPHYDDASGPVSYYGRYRELDLFAGPGRGYWDRLLALWAGDWHPGLMWFLAGPSRWPPIGPSRLPVSVPVPDWVYLSWLEGADWRPLADWLIESGPADLAGFLQEALSPCNTTSPPTTPWITGTPGAAGPSAPRAP